MLSTKNLRQVENHAKALPKCRTMQSNNSDQPSWLEGIDRSEVLVLMSELRKLSSVSGVFEDLGASSPSTHLRSFLPSFQKLPSFKIYLLSCGDMRCFPCSQGTIVPFEPNMVSSVVLTPSCREPRRWPNSWARSFGAVEVGLPILSEKIT